MAAQVNHYKLGLFVITGFAAAVLAAVFFGGAHMKKDVIRYHTYFNESVQGLELGAPVKFRGVTVGHVTAIEIAPDRRMVDVISELDTEDATRMGLTETGASHGKVRMRVPPDLRTQLNSQGITGIKFVAIDFFDVKNNPPPQLPFPAPRDNYIPAAPSMMKNLEDTLEKALDRLPEMVDAVVMIMGRIDGLIATLSKQDVSGKAAATLEHADETMRKLQHVVERIDAQSLGEKVSQTLSDVDHAVGKMNGMLDELSGQNGLIMSARHATDAFGDVGRASRNTQRDLERALRGVSEASEAVRGLVDSLERDPDMLLKGKAKRGSHP